MQEKMKKCGMDKEKIRERSKRGLGYRGRLRVRGNVEKKNKTIKKSDGDENVEMRYKVNKKKRQIMAEKKRKNTNKK